MLTPVIDSSHIRRAEINFARNDKAGARTPAPYRKPQRPWTACGLSDTYDATILASDSLSSCLGPFRAERPDMNENDPPSHRLTFDDAVDIWLRHWAGEYQHHIAASYRVNPGRVNDVLKGRKHAGSEQVAASKRRAA